MSKPSTAPTPKPPDYSGHPARRIRAILRKAGPPALYDVVEEIFSGPPTKTTLLKGMTPHVDAQYRVRLYLEEQMGAQRHGDSGLP